MFTPVKQVHMSKKLLFLAAFVALLGVAKLQADTLDTPQGSGNSLATADYGGVEYTTVTFSTANVQAFSGPGSIAWIHVTSANAAAFLTDFITIRDTDAFISTNSINAATGGTGDYSTNNEAFRIYVGTAIGTGQGYSNQWVSNGLTGFDYVFSKPIRLVRGAMIKCSSMTFGPITIGKTVFSGRNNR